MNKDFKSFATANCGISGTTLNKIESKLIIPQAYINPTILEERQLNVTQMDVFSRLMADRIIFLGTEIDDTVANVIIAQLLYLSSQDPEAPITMYLNTPGGSVYDGLAIYDTMQYIPNEVQTVCTGLAASMGSVLLCAGEKGKRFALPHSRIMIHQPLGGAHGQASDIEITAKEILKLKGELYQIIADHSGKTMKQIEKDADRDHWLTAKEAVAYGMIDDIFNIKK
jgi:ATP-dependent Clp protease protease subunit